MTQVSPLRLECLSGNYMVANHVESPAQFNLPDAFKIGGPIRRLLRIMHTQFLCQLRYPRGIDLVISGPGSLR